MTEEVRGLKVIVVVIGVIMVVVVVVVCEVGVAEGCGGRQRSEGDRQFNSPLAWDGAIPNLKFRD